MSVVFNISSSILFNKRFSNHSHNLNINFTYLFCTITITYRIMKHITFIFVFTVHSMIFAIKQLFKTQMRLAVQAYSPISQQATVNNEIGRDICYLLLARLSSFQFVIDLRGDGTARPLAGDISTSHSIVMFQLDNLLIIL